MYEHAPPVERHRSDLTGGAKQLGLHGVVDEVRHDLIGTQQRCRDSKTGGTGHADRRGVDHHGRLGDSLHVHQHTP